MPTSAVALALVTFGTPTDSRATPTRMFSEYEQRELRFHEEMQRKLGEYDVELDRLRNELDYLRSDNKNGRRTTLPASFGKLALQPASSGRRRRSRT